MICLWWLFYSPEAKKHHRAYLTMPAAARIFLAVCTAAVHCKEERMHISDGVLPLSVTIGGYAPAVRETGTCPNWR